MPRNPGEEPGPRVRRSWDRRAWKDARPDKVVPTDGAELVAALERRAARPRLPRPTPQPGLPMRRRRAPCRVRSTADGAVEAVLTRLGARRSAWNPADIRGRGREVDRRHRPRGRRGGADRAGRRPHRPRHRGVCPAAGPAGRARARPVPHLTAGARRRGRHRHPARLPSRRAGDAGGLDADWCEGLDEAQHAAVAVLAGTPQLVVVEGAAGAGKTTTLAAAKTAARSAGSSDGGGDPDAEGGPGRRPRGRHAAVSAAWLVHQHGFRWDDDGRWTRTDRRHRRPGARSCAPGDLLLVDEAGMLDQDTARALLTVADEMRRPGRVRR